MLRIERVESGNGETTLRATGRVAGPWVGELRRSLNTGDGAGVTVVDLTDVSFVDRDGIELLRGLKDEPRVRLRCSPFITEQLSGTEMTS